MKKLIDRLFPAAECGECPCGWEDCSCEGECYDCGCVLHKNGEMPESGFLCRLPAWIKSLLRDHIDRKRDRAMSRDCEDMTAWYEKMERRREAMAEAVAEVLPGLCLGWEDAGKLADAYETRMEKLQAEIAGKAAS